MQDHNFAQEVRTHRNRFAPEGPVTPGAIVDIGGQADQTVTPGAITDMAGGGGGSVAPNAITNPTETPVTEHGIGTVERDAL
jgi:hypothetical protein